MGATGCSSQADDDSREKGVPSCQQLRGRLPLQNMSSPVLDGRLPRQPHATGTHCRQVHMRNLRKEVRGGRGVSDSHSSPPLPQRRLLHPNGIQGRDEIQMQILR